MTTTAKKCGCGSCKAKAAKAAHAREAYAGIRRTLDDALAMLADAKGIARNAMLEVGDGLLSEALAKTEDDLREVETRIEKAQQSAALCWAALAPPSVVAPEPEAAPARPHPVPCP